MHSLFALTRRTIAGFLGEQRDFTGIHLSLNTATWRFLRVRRPDLVHLTNLSSGRDTGTT
jgi:hypothetical protein